MCKQTHFLPSSFEGLPCLALSQAGNAYHLGQLCSVQPDPCVTSLASTRTRRALVHHVRGKRRRTVRRSASGNATHEARDRTGQPQNSIRQSVGKSKRTNEETTAHMQHCFKSPAPPGSTNRAFGGGGGGGIIILGGGGRGGGTEEVGPA